MYKNWDDHIIEYFTRVVGPTIGMGAVGLGFAWWIAGPSFLDVQQAIRTAELLNMPVPVETLAKVDSIGNGILITAAVFAGIAAVVGHIVYASTRGPSI